MTTGIGLFSGGLDSMLAVCVLMDQGIDVHALTFETPFFTANKARQTAKHLNIPLTVMDITPQHLEMLKNPPHGYGRNLNPCIDCHALMLKFAGKFMKKIGADFIFTGEVLGERPMSQNMNSLAVVAKASGYRDYVLRPLSAQLLPETKPEKDGLIDRSKLLGIHGRSRKTQFLLAQKYGISDYETPSGGCALTYEGYSKKLKELLEHEPDAPLRHYYLLRTGRHFRLPDGNKLIVGKDKTENATLLSYLNDETDILLEPYDHPGPTAIIPDAENKPDILLASKIIARYSKPAQEIDVVITDKSATKRITISATDFSQTEIKQYLITR